MELAYFEKFLNSLLEDCNVDIVAGRRNRIDDLDKVMLELNDIQNSNTIDRILNRIYLERFHIKYPQFVELIKTNVKFKNRHLGDRCFILGNGPSLREQDLSLLRDEYVFTVNNLCRYDGFQAIKSNYHFYADPIYFDTNNKNEAVVLLRNAFIKDIKTEYSKNDTVCFLSTLGYDLVIANNLKSHAKIEYYSTPLKFYDGYDEDIDYAKPAPAFHTVVQWCITMAIYMGFKEIYLLGCDCDGIIELIDRRQSRHAYEINETERKLAEYLDSRYGTEAMFLGWAKIFHLYKQLRLYCEKRNIKLVNCSAKTVLDCIPIMRYEDVMKGLCSN